MMMTSVQIVVVPTTDNKLSGLPEPGLSHHLLHYTYSMVD